MPLSFGVQEKGKPMQTVLDAAAHIAQEIEKTRQRLADLEQALAALRPLISVSIDTPTLTFNSTVLQTVEDVSVIKTTRKKKLSPGKAASVKPKAVTLPKTGAELWLKCMGNRKITVNDVAASAVNKLGLSDDAMLVLRNRAAAWLNAAAKKNQVAVSTNKAGLNVYQVVRD